ncbi:MAG: glycosyltransferase family 2 protein, partial [Nitrososphaera sp.]
MAKISVLIPTYNRPEFLRLAIVSVLNQTFQDFEIIVVDDASWTPGTQSVTEGFADKRIKYVRHPVNRGLSAARNSGIRAAVGRYIALLDDDDEWLEEKLARQFSVIESSPLRVGVVYTGCFYIDRLTGRTARE